MADSNQPKKVRKDQKKVVFPLWKHPRGYWCKTIRGKHFYFGRIDSDPEGQAAIKEYYQRIDDIKAGCDPIQTKSPKSANPAAPVRLKDLCNAYLTAQLQKTDLGEITSRTFDEYRQACTKLIESMGKERSVESVRPEDFARLKSTLAESHKSPSVLGNWIQRIRSVFTYGERNGLIDRVVFGSSFDRPRAKLVREAKIAKGEMMYSAEEVRAMLEVATPTMKAAILLGVQGGFGNTDIAELPISAVDLENGWIRYARKKTAIQRSVPIWEETKAALKAIIHENSSGLVFVGERGRDFTYGDRNRIANQFKFVLKSSGVQTGRGFYSFRRTFQTIGETCLDFVAVKSIMGHANSTNDMSSIYRQRISDQRLRNVVETVHRWLFEKNSQNISS